MTVADTKAIKAYFRNDPKFGRSTQLIERATGRVLFEGLGVWTRIALWKQYEIQERYKRPTYQYVCGCEGSPTPTDNPCPACFGSLIVEAFGGAR